MEIESVRCTLHYLDIRLGVPFSQCFNCAYALLVRDYIVVFSSDQEDGRAKGAAENNLKEDVMLT